MDRHVRHINPILDLLLVATPGAINSIFLKTHQLPQMFTIKVFIGLALIIAFVGLW